MSSAKVVAVFLCSNCDTINKKRYLKYLLTQKGVPIAILFVSLQPIFKK
jgi:hypothetical protein